MKKLFIFAFVAILALAFFNACEDDESPTEATSTYTIGGALSDGTNAALEGITVELTGDATATDVTDANGEYEFADLKTGDYVVTPTSDFYTFNPANSTITGLNQDELADFQAQTVFEGTWLSAGTNVAPLLAFYFQYDSVRVVFGANTVELSSHVAGGAWSQQSGTYTVTKSDTGDVHTIEIVYTAFEQEGIVQVISGSPDTMKLEVVQTVPNIGAVPRTPETGFGSDVALGTSNIQTYVREN